MQHQDTWGKSRESNVEMTKSMEVLHSAEMVPFIYLRVVFRLEKSSGGQGAKFHSRNNKNCRKKLVRPDHF